MRKAIGAVLVMVLLAGFLAPLLPVAQHGVSPSSADHAETLRVEIRTSTPIEAGKPVQVDVSGAPAAGQVFLSAITAVGITTRQTTARAGRASFELPPSVTRIAGLATLVATSGDALALSELELVPGPANEPVTGIIGARSIVADGTDRSMLVTTPTDHLGNVLPDGTQVTVTRTRPTGETEQIEVKLENMIAFAYLHAGTKAGRDLVWVQAQHQTGPLASLDETAGPPAEVTLTTSGQIPRGDGRSLLTVVTAPLIDRYSNVEPDGTLVVLTWSGADGSGTATATTIAGVATFQLEAPANPDTFQIAASCRGTTTRQTLTIPFEPDVETVPVSATRGLEGIVVLVGPVLSHQGGYVADGTWVTVTAVDPAGHRVQAGAAATRGQARLVLPADQLSGALEITAAVLGTNGHLLLD